MVSAVSIKHVFMSYLETTKNVYRDAALTPDVGLCCTTNPIWELPGLKIPKIMQEMNYGCGSTVNARDLTNNPRILYVGAGGGMELSPVKKTVSSVWMSLTKCWKLRVKILLKPKR